MVEPPVCENISQTGSSPQVGVNIKDIWNHHPAMIWVKVFQIFFSLFNVMRQSSSHTGSFNRLFHVNNLANAVHATAFCSPQLSGPNDPQEDQWIQQAFLGTQWAEDMRGHSRRLTWIYMTPRWEENESTKWIRLPLVFKQLASRNQILHNMPCLFPTAAFFAACGWNGFRWDMTLYTSLSHLFDLFL